jgi:hypothetical protein
MSNTVHNMAIRTYSITFCLPFLIVINTLTRVHEKKSIFSMLLHKTTYYAKIHQKVLVLITFYQSGMLIISSVQSCRRVYTVKYPMYTLLIFYPEAGISKNY